MKREFVSFYLPDIEAIEESALEVNSQAVGYHCTVRSTSGAPLGSGCNRSAAVARQVAIAEAIERRIFQTLSTASGANDELLLNEYPSSCGFALGTDESSTQSRAKAEAVERWLRSKWIDEQQFIPRTKLYRSELSPLAAYLFDSFDQVLSFRISNSLSSADGLPEIFYSLITVGLADGGAFVGSKTSPHPENLEEHALVESWRHLKIFQQVDRYPKLNDYEQIAYFGQNADSAMAQIPDRDTGAFPEPKLRILRQVNTAFPNDLYLYRALCENYRGWHGPDIKRFVY